MSIHDARLAHARWFAAHDREPGIDERDSASLAQPDRRMRGRNAGLIAGASPTGLGHGACAISHTRIEDRIHVAPAEFGRGDEVEPLPMNGSSTRSPVMYRRISCSGSSTGNGAGWPTRGRSPGDLPTSSVERHELSDITVLSCGNPFRGTLLHVRARSKRPLLA